MSPSGREARSGRRAARAPTDLAPRRGAARRRSPVASASAWRSRGRSRASPPSCSSTSRSRPRRPHASHGPRRAARVIRTRGLPTVLVTHDFEDAATLADRVGVIVEGTILQVGTPAELVAGTRRPVRRQLHRRHTAAGHGLRRRGTASRRSRWTQASPPGRPTSAAGAWRSHLPLGGLDRARDARRHRRQPRPRADRLARRARQPRAAPRRPAGRRGDRRSAARLGLREGEVVVASFKATAARLLPL